MSSWQDRQSSRVRSVQPPPIGPDGAQIEPPSYGLVRPLESRRLQAEAIGAALRRLGSGLARALATARMLISCAGAGAAKRAPDRLTTECR